MRHRIKMSKSPVVVVFPSRFSVTRMRLLASNIKKMLDIKGQKFSNITIDGQVVRVDADDPVIASSVIGLLFGIRQVSIANTTSLDFDDIVQETGQAASRLLLDGEKFLVRVDGKAPGYMPKDAEIAITSKIIQGRFKEGIAPGTAGRYDKLFYVFLGDKAGYVCLFTDKGPSGVPNGSHRDQILCCIYDGLSAVAALGAVRSGYQAEFMVCYRDDAELLKSVRALDKILDRIPKRRHRVDFLHMKSVADDHLWKIAFKMLVRAARERKIGSICIAASPLVNSSKDIDWAARSASDAGLIPHMPLSGLDGDLAECAKEIGLEKLVADVAPRAGIAMKSPSESTAAGITGSITTHSVTVGAGPNRIHDILDSLGVER